MTLPLSRFYQPLLEGWTLDDPEGLVDTVTDGPGYTDIVTNDISPNQPARVFFSKPMKDFLGGASGADARHGVLLTYAGMISGDLAEDYLGVGLSDSANSHPTTTPAALFEWMGHRHSASSGFDNAACGDQTTEVTASSSVVITGDPFSIGAIPFHNGRAGFANYSFLWQTSGPTYKAVRGLNQAVRLVDYSHVIVVLKQVAAGVQTIRVKTGFLLVPSIPDLSISARKV